MRQPRFIRLYSGDDDPCKQSFPIIGSQKNWALFLKIKYHYVARDRKPFEFIVLKDPTVLHPWHAILAYYDKFGLMGEPNHFNSAEEVTIFDSTLTNESTMHVVYPFDRRDLFDNVDVAFRTDNGISNVRRVVHYIRAYGGWYFYGWLFFFFLFYGRRLSLKSHDFVVSDGDSEKLLGWKI